MSCKKITVQSSLPVRIDRYLRRLYPDISQGMLEKYLRTGKIKLNGKKVKSSFRVNDADIIELYIEISVDINSVNRSFPDNVKILAKKLFNEYLLLETDFFIAIKKPEGIAVQGGSKISLSIDDALNYLNHTEYYQLKLVHRLDKNTSGVLLIAKGYDEAVKLTGAFKDKLIEKTYIAVLDGVLNKKSGVVSNLLFKDFDGDREIIKVTQDESLGKEAQTKYQVLDEGEGKTLMQFNPITGRMHQLRVHSQVLGCPILGDTKYGHSNAKRMFLHAAKIIIPKSLFGQEYEVNAELPVSFKV